MDYMALILYFEIINAILSVFILIMLLYLLWIITTRYNIVRSILFLKGDRLKNPTIIISFAILLFVIRETYKATGLIGIQTSKFFVELLELGTTLLIFFGVFMVFRLFRMRTKKNVLEN